MNLTKEPNATATVAGAVAGALSPSTVYLADKNGAGGLPEGKKVVLATAAGYSAELTVTATIGTPVAADTTYVTPDQFGKTGNWNDPTLRLYTWRETWRKVRSPAGILLLLTTVAAWSRRSPASASRSGARVRPARRTLSIGPRRPSSGRLPQPSTSTPARQRARLRLHARKSRGEGWWRVDALLSSLAERHLLPPSCANRTRHQGGRTRTPPRGSR
jgi:hypothetical protein